ncbi:hypothetical protein H6G81_19195 [Scytonema hofmannii FACHB-248]|uniref:Uncharacterized protein n=1 Tax=Scytonema hofmannii FACHB-248 TaxID=1842502 RepID=A0ABR8GTN8_9CYAN|nr:MULTISPECIES: hypothetical protein [Nostocales]MBD2606599.1 hypothetical protein [Scytonema hofmannii FACHB-248]
MKTSVLSLGATFWVVHCNIFIRESGVWFYLVDASLLPREKKRYPTQALFVCQASI